MTKHEIIAISRKLTGSTWKASQAHFGAAFIALKEAIIANGDFAIPGFGRFVVISKKARTGTDPRTGEKIQIAARKAVVFRPSLAFKQALNKKQGE